MITLEKIRRDLEKGKKEGLKWKEEDRRRRQKDRLKALWKWRRNQPLKGVLRYGLKKYPTVFYEKCPHCSSDVKSIFPPSPLIKAFRQKRKKIYGGIWTPAIYVFQCLMCRRKCADYHRFQYVHSEKEEVSKVY